MKMFELKDEIAQLKEDNQKLKGKSARSSQMSLFFQILTNFTNFL